MDTDRFLDSSELPELRRPVMLAAFAGWNDAGQAATFALSALRTMWSAKRFAGIDSEEFFDFTESRPMISLTPQGQRSLEWPLNEFYAHQIPDAPNDVVLLIGTEPQLKWRSFCTVVRRVAEQLDASCLLTLGALLADVPHTVDPRVTGFSTVPSGSPDFKSLGITTSSYEGPTGILGVLHDSWRQLDRPGVSLWGNVPHYISASPNPHVALSLLRRALAITKLEVPLETLETRATAFQAQIDEALAENPDAMEYVQQLEKQFASEHPSATAPELIEELEKYLRSRRPPEEPKPPRDG
jgi:proteasome assembly chaperone (PAC2) family protein